MNYQVQDREGRTLGETMDTFQVTPAEWDRALKDARNLTLNTLRYLPAHVDGEEALSRAVFAVVEAARCYEPAKSNGFGGWARQWVNWRLRRWVKEDLRHTQRFLPLCRPIPDPAGDPEKRAVLLGVLDGGLNSLDETRAFVACRVMDGWATEEIAEELGLSVNRTRKLRVEAFRKLRAVLREEGVQCP
jgi:RNA polymerase sigma factor (sigma-70 family)